MNIHFKKYTFILILFFVVLFLFWIFQNNYKVLAVSSPDAIAVRVLPNEFHVGIERWYNEQDFTGSPQTLKVDGYDAIRDGRTVYVAAANAVGQNLFTYIYLISYNQTPEQETIDIFGQILSHWKFNTNVPTVGNCNNDAGQECLYDEECGINNYCTSQKAMITRDVKRMADIVDIRLALENYRDVYQKYPTLSSGTYIPGATISTWPSWHETFEKEIGLTLSDDPINNMGLCSADRFSQDTCWDDANKEFDGYIPDDLPAGSRVYSYSTDGGSDYGLCSLLETTYANIQSFNCYAGAIGNRPPEIVSVNLSGYPKQEFKGYVEAIDLDGDWISYDVELVGSLSPSEWDGPAYQWVWDTGLDKFKINNTFVDSQKEIHATQAGNANETGLYQVRITLDDGNGGITHGDYPVIIQGLDPQLTSVDNNLIIGDSGDFTLTGWDASLNPINNLILDNATFDGNVFTPLSSQGFILQGMDLMVVYNSGQHTGEYIINVHAEDQTTLETVDSLFNIHVINNPPVINSFSIKYSNNTGCTLGPNCEFIIDNGENASVFVNATDPDPNHIPQYYLVDDFGQISINNNTGEISGLNNLNYQGESDQSFVIEVRVEDGYCANSEPDECSVTDNFEITVNKICSVVLGQPGYINRQNFDSANEFDLLNGVPTTDTFMTDIGFPPPDSCSSIGNGLADIDIEGLTESADMVFVVDTSESMDGQYLSGPLPPVGDRPIDYAIDALEDTINNLHSYIVNNLPPLVEFKVGIIPFSTGWAGDTVDFGDIRDNLFAQIIINEINTYGPYGGTNTFQALVAAENMLEADTSSPDNKIVVLLSDGKPEILQSYSGCTNWCSGGGVSPQPHVSLEDDHIFKIASVTQQYCTPSYNCHYSDACDVCTPSSCPNNSTCTDGCDYRMVNCYYLNKFAEIDVGGQAEFMKNLGYDIYTIFFDTGTFWADSDIMCDWSSEADCSAPSNYSFNGESDDLSSIFDEILDNVFSKPNNIFINNQSVNYNQTDALTQTITGWNGVSDLLSCDDDGDLLALYNNRGNLTVKNISFDYCEKLLHN